MWKFWGKVSHLLNTKGFFQGVCGVCIVVIILQYILLHNKNTRFANTWTPFVGMTTGERVRARQNAAYDGAVVFPGNGHRYKVFKAPQPQNAQLSWLDAMRECEKLGGHLCTITSSLENKFVLDLVSRDVGSTFWLGALRIWGSTSWEWVTEEPFAAFAYWGREQPNNRLGEIYLGLSAKYDGGPWRWHDFLGLGEARNYWANGYICEWEPE
jgi:hypothetical protein